MEQWEIDRRKELEASTPNTSYVFSAGTYTIGTGKGGAIDLQIAIEKEVRKMQAETISSAEAEPKYWFERPDILYEELTEEKLREVLTALLDLKSNL